MTYDYVYCIFLETGFDHRRFIFVIYRVNVAFVSVIEVGV